MKNGEEGVPDRGTTTNLKKLGIIMETTEVINWFDKVQKKGEKPIVLKHFKD